MTVIKQLTSGDNVTAFEIMVANNFRDVLDAQLEKMLGATIPDYNVLRKVVPGLEEILIHASDSTLVRITEQYKGRDAFPSYEITAGILRTGLKNCVRQGHCWEFQAGGETREFYDCETSYWVTTSSQLGLHL